MCGLNVFTSGLKITFLSYWATSETSIFRAFTDVTTIVLFNLLEVRVSLFIFFTTSPSFGLHGSGSSPRSRAWLCRRKLCAAHCDSLSTLRVRYGGVHGVVRVSIVLHGRQARWWLSCDGEAESVGYLGVACTKASACRGVFADDCRRGRQCVRGCSDRPTRVVGRGICRRNIQRRRFSGDDRLCLWHRSSFAAPRHSAFMMRRPCDQSAQRTSQICIPR